MDKRTCEVLKKVQEFLNDIGVARLSPTEWVSLSTIPINPGYNSPTFTAPGTGYVTFVSQRTNATTTSSMLVGTINGQQKFSRQIPSGATAPYEEVTVAVKAGDTVQFSAPNQSTSNTLVGVFKVIFVGNQNMNIFA